MTTNLNKESKTYTLPAYLQAEIEEIRSTTQFSYVENSGWVDILIQHTISDAEQVLLLKAENKRLRHELKSLLLYAFQVSNEKFS